MDCAAAAPRYLIEEALSRFCKTISSTARGVKQIGEEIGPLPCSMSRRSPLALIVGIYRVSVGRPRPSRRHVDWYFALVICRHCADLAVVGCVV